MRHLNAAGTWRLLNAGAFTIAGTLLLGLGLSLVLYVRARHWEQESLARALTSQAQESAELVRVETLRSMEALRAVAAFYQARGEFTRAEFRQFCDGTLNRQPELFALGWSPYVARESRIALETAARADGLDFTFTAFDPAGRTMPAPERDVYALLPPGVRE